MRDIVNHAGRSRSHCGRIGRLERGKLGGVLALGPEVRRRARRYRGLQEVAVNSLVEELRFGAFVRLAAGDPLRRDDRGDGALRIVEVARDNRLSRAHDHACGLEVPLDAMRAVVALGGGVRVRDRCRARRRDRPACTICTRCSARNRNQQSRRCAGRATWSGRSRRTAPHRNGCSASRRSGGSCRGTRPSRYT